MKEGRKEFRWEKERKQDGMKNREALFVCTDKLYNLFYFSLSAHLSCPEFLCVYKKSCKARLSKKIRRGLHRKSDETKWKEMKLALEKKRNHDYVHHSYKTTKQFQVPINSNCTTVETAILHIEEKRRWTYFVNFYLLCFIKKRDM